MPESTASDNRKPPGSGSKHSIDVGELLDLAACKTYSISGMPLLSCKLRLHSFSQTAILALISCGAPCLYVQAFVHTRLFDSNVHRSSMPFCLMMRHRLLVRFAEQMSGILTCTDLSKEADIHDPGGIQLVAHESHVMVLPVFCISCLG